MKKFTMIVAMFLSIFTFAFAQDIGSGAVDGSGTVDAVVTSAEVENVVNTANDNSENVYYYFYGEGCSYCILLNQFFEANDVYERFDIEKFEIWNDRENAAKMTEYLEQVWIPLEQAGTPFIVVNPDQGSETYGLNGLDQAIDHFENELTQRGFEIKEYEPPVGKKNTVNYILIGIFLVIVVLWIVYYNKK